MSPLWTALVVLFVAELSDQPRLVALRFGARSRRGGVLTGIGLAYLAANLVSVVVGAGPAASPCAATLHRPQRIPTDSHGRTSWSGGDFGKHQASRLHA